MALKGNNNAEKIWYFLIEKLNNPYGVAGLMGNLYAESGLRPNNLQNTSSKKFNMSDEEYEEFLKNEYFKYPQFRKNGRIRLHWLNRLKSSKEVRNMFQHVTSLHYLGTEYTKKTPVEYIASMMRMYFYDDNKKWAYFRVPTLSNKPSEEYIRFERIHQGYEDFVIDKLYDVFAYELDRI